VGVRDAQGICRLRRGNAVMDALFVAVGCESTPVTSHVDHLIILVVVSLTGGLAVFIYQT